MFSRVVAWAISPVTNLFFSGGDSPEATFSGTPTSPMSASVKGNNEAHQDVSASFTAAGESWGIDVAATLPPFYDQDKSSQLNQEITPPHEQNPKPVTILTRTDTHSEGVNGINSGHSINGSSTGIMAAQLETGGHAGMSSLRNNFSAPIGLEQQLLDALQKIIDSDKFNELVYELRKLLRANTVESIQKFQSFCKEKSIDTSELLTQLDELAEQHESFKLNHEDSPGELEYLQDDPSAVWIEQYQILHRILRDKSLDLCYGTFSRMYVDPENDTNKLYVHPEDEAQRYFDTSPVISRLRERKTLLSLEKGHAHWEERLDENFNISLNVKRISHIDDDLARNLGRILLLNLPQAAAADDLLKEEKILNACKRFVSDPKNYSDPGFDTRRLKLFISQAAKKNYAEFNDEKLNSIYNDIQNDSKLKKSRTALYQTEVNELHIDPDTFKQLPSTSLIQVAHSMLMTLCKGNPEGQTINLGESPSKILTWTAFLCATELGVTLTGTAIDELDENEKDKADELQNAFSALYHSLDLKYKLPPRAAAAAVAATDSGSNHLSDEEPEEPRQSIPIPLTSNVNHSSRMFSSSSSTNHPSRTAQMVERPATTVVGPRRTNNPEQKY